MLSNHWTDEEAKLIRSREQALNDIAHLQEEITSEVNIEIDEADEQITEHETAAILINMLANKIVNINSAITAIEMGRYGYCARCGEVIEAERLQAKPDASLCIICQKETERLQQELVYANSK